MDLIKVGSCKWFLNELQVAEPWFRLTQRSINLHIKTWNWPLNSQSNVKQCVCGAWAWYLLKCINLPNWLRIDLAINTYCLIYMHFFSSLGHLPVMSIVPDSWYIDIIIMSCDFVHTPESATPSSGEALSALSSVTVSVLSCVGVGDNDTLDNCCSTCSKTSAGFIKSCVAWKQYIFICDSLLHFIWRILFLSVTQTLLHLPNAIDLFLIKWHLEMHNAEIQYLYFFSQTL